MEVVFVLMIPSTIKKEKRLLMLFKFLGVTGKLDYTTHISETTHDQISITEPCGDAK